MRDRRRRFAFRLSLALGCPDPDVMLDSIPAQTFIEWIAYYQLEPFGILASDAISAHWKAMYANVNRKRGTTAYKPEKFLLFRDERKDASALFEREEDE